jgi:hypothetical protein
MKPGSSRLVYFPNKNRYPSCVIRLACLQTRIYRRPHTPVLHQTLERRSRGARLSDSTAWVFVRTANSESTLLINTQILIPRGSNSAGSYHVVTCSGVYDERRVQLSGRKPSIKFGHMRSLLSCYRFRPTLTFCDASHVYVGVLISLRLLLFASTTKRNFLGWVNEVRTTKS